jgi:hypothetical protein
MTGNILSPLVRVSRWAGQLTTSTRSRCRLRRCPSRHARPRAATKGNDDTARTSPTLVSLNHVPHVKYQPLFELDTISGIVVYRIDKSGFAWSDMPTCIIASTKPEDDGTFLDACQTLCASFQSLCFPKVSAVSTRDRSGTGSKHSPFYQLGMVSSSPRLTFS